MILAIAQGSWSQLIYVVLVSLTFGVGSAQLIFRWLWANDVREADPNPRRGTWNARAIKVWAAATATTAYTIAGTVYHYKTAPLTFWLLMPLLSVLISKSAASVVSWFAYRVASGEAQREHHGAGG